MKIQITFKDPDGVSYSVEQVAAEKGLEVGEIEPLLKTWVEYNEYVTVEIDTDTNTAIVIPVRR